ncbi:unnamed protein product [Danaus chrysippus]|uniref:(African queen) hypothetical protein n=1 Tax=Danaus chrysippus TaxID=151541 RepID=A0A8J2QI94_9NEOP|nr:unnamed protein product [Danaus chrysippus]
MEETATSGDELERGRLQAEYDVVGHGPGWVQTPRESRRRMPCQEAPAQLHITEVRAIPKYLRSLLRERPFLHYPPRPAPLAPPPDESYGGRLVIIFFNLSSLANTMEAPPRCRALPRAEYCIGPLAL